MINHDFPSYNRHQQVTSLVHIVQLENGVDKVLQHEVEDFLNKLALAGCKVHSSATEAGYKCLLEVNMINHD